MYLFAVYRCIVLHTNIKVSKSYSVIHRAMTIRDIRTESCCQVTPDDIDSGYRNSFSASSTCYPIHRSVLSGLNTGHQPYPSLVAVKDSRGDICAVLDGRSTGTGAVNRLNPLATDLVDWPQETLYRLALPFRSPESDPGIKNNTGRPKQLTPDRALM